MSAARLNEIALCDNALNPEGARILSPILAKVGAAARPYNDSTLSLVSRKHRSHELSICHQRPPLPSFRACARALSRVHLCALPVSAQHCPGLQILRLDNTGVGPLGGKFLGLGLLEGARQGLRLKVFSLGRSRMENKGSTAVAKALKVPPPHRALSSVYTTTASQMHFEEIESLKKYLERKGV